MRTLAAPATNSDNETTSYGPPLKWAGGKRWQVPHLQRLWEPHRNRRLVEPFCGGLSVALGLKPERALLNDVNAHLINFYRWVKRGLSVESSLLNSRVRYYANRRRFNELAADSGAGTAEAATLFYYLNKTGYNGLCRFNRSGLFNVPFGRHKKISYRQHFDDYAKVFRHWQFKAVDFERLELDDADFIYADPPYDVEFRQYSQGGFDWAEQVRAAEWLAAHPGPVVLTNQATDRIVSLYRKLDFRLVFLAAPRRISCNGDRTPAEEVLAVRNLEV
jgi:DNA adenine methylase